LNKKIRLKIDILYYVIGEILLIECVNKRWRLVAYLLKSLNKIEYNYKFHNKKILTMIRGLEI